MENKEIKQETVLQISAVEKYKRDPYVLTYDFHNWKWISETHICHDQQGLSIPFKEEEWRGEVSQAQRFFYEECQDPAFWEVKAYKITQNFIYYPEDDEWDFEDEIVEELKIK